MIDLLLQALTLVLLSPVIFCVVTLSLLRAEVMGMAEAALVLKCCCLRLAATLC